MNEPRGQGRERDRSPGAEPPRTGDRPSASGRRRGEAGAPGGGAEWLTTAVAEAVAIGREMLRIPAGIALAVAERLGLWLLEAWRRLVPLLRAGGGRGLGLLHWAARELTPVRALSAVIVAALALLVVSQFVDFRAVSVGAPQYSEVEAIAPAPQREVQDAIWAHSVAVLVVAAGALVLLALALRGRWQLARLLALVGLAVLALSLADMPKALDEDVAAIAYEGAEARLLNGFWAQLAAGVTVGLCGPLLAAYLNPAPARGASRRRSRRPAPVRHSGPATGGRARGQRLRVTRNQGARP